MRKTYTSNEIVSFEEDQEHEFKGFEEAQKRLKENELIRKIFDYSVECISAFLSTNQGTLYLGIEDNGRVTGIQLNRSQRDDLKKRISQAVDRDFYPSVEPNLYDIKFVPVLENGSDTFVIEILVLKGPESVYWIESKGKAYLRRKAGNFPMSPDMITRRTKGRKKTGGPERFVLPGRISRLFGGVVLLLICIGISFIGIVFNRLSDTPVTGQTATQTILNSDTISSEGTPSQADQQPTHTVIELATATLSPTAEIVSETMGTSESMVTPILTLTYQEPSILLEHSAVGKSVSDNFTLPGCQKAVFNYSVQASDIGYASLILELNKVDEDRSIALVNSMEETSRMMGQVLQPLIGGEYYFSSENTVEPWEVVLECYDNAAPVAEGIDLKGKGLTVSPNYYLPDCQKSVFMWESQPDGSGFASIIVSLYFTNEGELNQVHIVNDMTEGTITGETLQPVVAGDYFLTIENTTAPWSIRWECRD